MFQFFGHQGPYFASEWSEVNPESKEMVVRTVNVSSLIFPLYIYINYI